MREVDCSPVACGGIYGSYGTDEDIVSLGCECWLSGGRVLVIKAEECVKLAAAKRYFWNGVFSGLANSVNNTI